jgi:ATP-binding cassette subfamily C protein LapB
LKQADESRKTLEELTGLPRENEKGVAIKDYTGRLSFHDVAFRYVGTSAPLFESLSLDLAPGRILVITGGNGTGKTTLIRLVTGLLECSRGDILADDINLKQITMYWWRRQFIYLPQEPHFLLASIRENISLGKEIDDSRFNQILHAAGLRQFLDKSAKGLEMILADPEQIPPGIRKRIALARALVTDGQIILFDEPTVGLDGEGCRVIYELLNRSVQAGKTIIIGTNDPYIIKAAHIQLDLNHKPKPLMTTGHDRIQ